MKLVWFYVLATQHLWKAFSGVIIWKQTLGHVLPPRPRRHRQRLNILSHNSEVYSIFDNSDNPNNTYRVK